MSSGKILWSERFMLLRAACEASYATSQSWKVDPCDDSIAPPPPPDLR